MRIELAVPGSMPGLLDLNTLAEQRGEAVAAEMFASHDHGVNITDIDVAATQEEAMADLVERLQGVFYPYPEEELEAQVVTFRGIALAANLTARLTQHANLEADSEPESDKLFAETAISEACKYLIARPQLDRIIGKFLQLIEPDPSRSTNARLVVAHQCKAIDRHMQEVHSQQVLADGIAQIRQWNGIVPRDMLLE